MIEYADIVAGMAWGDEGKGKVVDHLAKNREYDFVCRWAGGPNAGHTVYVGGKRYKTHLIPSGVFSGTTSIIGPACVLNPTKFFEEINYLEENGFDCSLVKVSPRTHIISSEHIRSDEKSLSQILGTTGNGIAPCYGDKAYRKGTLAKDIASLEKFLWDGTLSGKILCEGAQGIWLDLDWGNYPFVTSSTCAPYGACSLGISPHKLREIWGVAKIYDTRSGRDPLFPTTLNLDPNFREIQRLGHEFGTTTGRRRQVNWLNLTKLVEAINLSGATHIVINKCDILEQLGIFKLYWENELYEFQTLKKMQAFITMKIYDFTNIKKPLYLFYSSSPLKIN